LKVDNFESVLENWPSSFQKIARNLDRKIVALGPVRRYTSGVPDIRYQLAVKETVKPVFARVRQGENEVLVEIERVLDPLHRTRPREKKKKWKPRSPRSDLELPLVKPPDWYDVMLVAESMVSSMTGRSRSK